MDFYVTTAGKPEGPLTEADIRKRIIAGELGQHSLCWTDGWTDRRRLIDTFPDAFNAMAQQMPSEEPPLKPVRKSPRGFTERNTAQNPMAKVAIGAIVVSAIVLLIGWLLLR